MLWGTSVPYSFLLFLCLTNRNDYDMLIFRRYGKGKNIMAKDITGTFNSRWDDDVVIASAAVFDLLTGGLISVNENDTEGLDICHEEWFEPSVSSQESHGLDEKIPICEDCHEYLMKPVMNDVDGTNLEEGYECSGSCGNIEKKYGNLFERTIDLGCFGIILNLDEKVNGSVSGSITSDLHAQFADNTTDADFSMNYGVSDAAADALESFILALACQDIDIKSPDFLCAIETAVLSIGNNL